jgi:hypothetical protein
MEIKYCWQPGYEATESVSDNFREKIKNRKTSNYITDSKKESILNGIQNEKVMLDQEYL